MSAPATLDPSRTALLVMDFQHAVLGALESTNNVDALLGRVSDTIDAARTAGALVVYVRSAFSDEDLDAIPNTNKVFGAQSATRGMHHDHRETAIHQLVAPQPHDIVIDKVRLGAFSTSDLDAQLRERGIENLILTGVFSRGVLLATAVEAVDRDYPAWIVADGAADPEPHVHEVLVASVFSFQAHVITTADVPALLDVPS